MKKIINLLFFSVILMACSNEENQIDPVEIPEPVTKIIHECECSQEEEPINTETEIEPTNEGLMEPELEVEAEVNATPNLDDNENVEDSSLPDVIDNPEINQILPNGSEEQEVLNQVTTYTVLAGDTLTQIAQKFGVTAIQIQAWNNLASVDSLYVGQVLNILGATNNVPVSTPTMDNQQSNLVHETIEYLLNGQENIRESEQLNWNPTFLQQVNFGELHQQFIAEGGAPENIEGFAQFVTLNAPIHENWEELFKIDFYAIHGIEITNLTAISGDRYRAYIEVNGVETPEVIVSARTGFYRR